MLHWAVTSLLVLAILASVLGLRAIAVALVAAAVLVACLWMVVGLIARLASDGSHALR